MLAGMKTGTRVLAVAILAAMGVAPAGATVLVYESFDYAAGSPLHGQVLDGTHTWEAYADNGANVVANAGLSFADAGYIGYGTAGLAGIVSGANAAPGWSSYMSLDIPVFYPSSPPAEPTTFYYSFLVRSEAGSTAFEANGTRPNAPYGAYVAGVYMDGSSVWTLDAYNQPTGTFPTASSGIPATLGETSFIVMRWRMSGDWQITVDLAVNPSFDAEPTTWDATLSFQRSIPFTIWRLSTSQGGSATYDEMRLSTTWADALPVAVPEPTACALLLGSLAAFAATRRVRARAGKWTRV